MSNSSSASFNTAIGYQTLYNLSTGYDNIMLGHIANTAGNNVTTGFNNILLGYNAGLGTTTDSKNFLNIGNSFFGIMVSTSTATSLPTDFSQAKFGVGTSTPWAMLSVNPTAGMTGPAFVVGSSSATTFVVTNGGLVGIGTTSPSQALSVQGNGLFSGNLTAANLTATGTLSVTGVTTLVNASTTNLSIANNLWVGGNATTTSAGTFTTNGSVGIGVTSPSYKLDVAGFIKQLDTILDRFRTKKLINTHRLNEPIDC